jgi:hypothetical protein
MSTDNMLNFHRGNEASALAYERSKHTLSRDRQQILEMAVAAGDRGITCDEVEAALGLKHQTASARITDLKCENWLKPKMLDLGQGMQALDMKETKKKSKYEMRRTRTGSLATVYLMGDGVGGFVRSRRYRKGRRIEEQKSDHALAHEVMSDAISHYERVGGNLLAVSASGRTPETADPATQQAAWDQGHEAGYSDGYEKGRADGKQDREAAVAAAQGIVESRVIAAREIAFTDGYNAARADLARQVGEASAAVEERTFSGEDLAKALAAAETGVIERVTEFIEKRLCMKVCAKVVREKFLEKK